jgi:hypothetical protein
MKKILGAIVLLGVLAAPAMALNEKIDGGTGGQSGGGIIPPAISIWLAMIFG